VLCRRGGSGSGVDDGGGGNGGGVGGVAFVHRRTAFAAQPATSTCPSLLSAAGKWASLVRARDIEFSHGGPLASNRGPGAPRTLPAAAMSHLSDTSRLKATVFVGGLDPAVTQQTLLHAFLPFGDIVQVHLPKPDLPTANEPHRGFGYVEFEAASDATEAIDNMDRSELYGSVIKVAAAKPQKDATEGLGSKTAIWEQVGSEGQDRQTWRIMLTSRRRAGSRSML